MPTWFGAAVRRPCTVYSLGGSSNTQFEQEMARISACQIRTFDLNCFEKCAAGLGGECYPRALRERLQCERLVVGPTDQLITAESQGKETFAGSGRMDPTTLPIQMRTLASLMRAHGDEAIDVLKIDIEGSEFAVLEPLLRADSAFPWHNISQLLIETHVGMRFWELGMGFDYCLL
jgi:FkbM family methyltransferase